MRTRRDFWNGFWKDGENEERGSERGTREHISLNYRYTEPRYPSEKWKPLYRLPPNAYLALSSQAESKNVP